VNTANASSVASRRTSATVTKKKPGGGSTSARRGSDRVARCGERAFQIGLDLECGLVLDTVQYEQYCMKMVQRVRVTVRGFKESGPMEDLT